MGSGNIIIGVVLIATFMVPFIISGIRKSNNKKKMLESLRAIANENNGSVSIHEFCSDFIIGMDQTKHLVFFYKKQDKKEIKTSINLADMKSCKVHILRREMEGNKGADRVIEKLDLSFTPHDKSKNVVNLQFYNTDESAVLTGELQVIEKWSKLVNDSLPKVPKLSYAS